MVTTRFQPEKTEELPAPGIGFRLGKTGNVGGNGHIFERCELRQQMVKLKYKTQFTVPEPGKLLLPIPDTS